VVEVLEQTGPAVPDPGHPGCPVGVVTLARQSGLGFYVAAKSSAVATLEGAARMSASAPEGCSGATFRIPLKFEGWEP